MESTYRPREIKHVVAKLSKSRVSDKVLGRKESTVIFGDIQILNKMV